MASYNITDPVAELSLVAFLPISIICCVSIGLPLNLWITGLIITQQRLRKPRHIFFLAVIFSCLFAQLLSLNELLVFYIAPSFWPACLTFSFLVGIPYANLLLNLFFCLVDRYAAITHPMWHKNKMTTSRIITAQLLGFFSILVLFKINLFLDGNLSEIKCQQHQPQGKIMIFTLMALVLLCFIAQIVIYLKTKRHFIHQREGQCRPLSQKAEISLSIINRLNQLDIIEETSINLPQATASNISRQDSSIVVHIKRQTTNKLEVEAAMTLAFGVGSLLLISSPIFIGSLGILFCNEIYSDCTTSTWMIPYFRELILVHTIYKPLMYIWRSSELFSATSRHN